MRTAFVVCLFAASSLGQQPAPAADLQQALVGRWAGYLEYRDYSEPPSSIKRVQLPTWLAVMEAPGGLSLHYVYDDGQSKVVDETEQWSFDVTRRSCTIREAGHADQSYSVSGLDALHDGHGTLVLTGSGTDNKQASEQRLTVTVRRNLVEWLLETRPAGSADPFVFRHLFRFTRADPPAISAAKP